MMGRNFVENLGGSGLKTARLIGGMALLLRDTMYWTFVAPWRGYSFRWKATFSQMARFGVSSIPITGLVLLFVGMILAFQMARVLQTLGFMDWVADIIGVATTRELGPLLTAIVMSGFGGAAIAAELGTMVVTEEVMALETSALEPNWFLVMPRVLGMMLMMPCLTVIANIIGIAGGLLISANVLGMSADKYITRTVDAMILQDIITGLIKSEAFAIVIAMTACYEGLNATGGAEGVSKATTRAVVNCIVFIIAVDCAFTALFYYVL
jgi:phospholipid/cholesterol/gamma-HCH transport system permease protein